MQKLESKKRLYYITFLQVIGPIFVILGHSINGLPANDILLKIKEIIYVFHMPLFFFISGYLFLYKGGLSNISYKDFMKKKIWRLLFPYFVLNLIFILPKFLLSGFLDDKVNFSISYIFRILIRPRDNILGHTWFLVALFIMYAFAPLWNYCIKKNKKILWGSIITLGIIMYIFQIDTRVFAIKDLCNNTIFFIFGMLMAKVAVNKLNIGKIKFLIFFLVVVTFTVLWEVTNNQIIKLILCTCDLLILLLIPIVFNIQNEKINELGKYSYSVYIMHWPIMLAMRIVLYQILHINYLIVASIMLMAGLLIPLLIIKIINLIKEKYNINSKYLYYLIGI